MMGFTPEEEELVAVHPVYVRETPNIDIGLCPECNYPVKKIASGCCATSDIVLDHICSKEQLVEPGHAPMYSEQIKHKELVAA